MVVRVTATAGGETRGKVGLGLNVGRDVTIGAGLTDAGGVVGKTIGGVSGNV